MFIPYALNFNPMQRKLTKAEVRQLEQLASKVYLDNKTYYFMPFWIEKRDDKEDYYYHYLEFLPKELQDVLNDRREAK